MTDPIPRTNPHVNSAPGKSPNLSKTTPLTPTRRAATQSPTMVYITAFWGVFGLATRFWQLGIQRRPFISKPELWIYPCYGLTGLAVGYWLEGVQGKQEACLNERKAFYLQKRKEMVEREREKREVGGQEAAMH
ncbi:hypothetical protein E4U51_006021 [Claviceps purpurea]|nr:hypothetical protein E4U51_006021 [Claviceps purpurea]